MTMLGKQDLQRRKNFRIDMEREFFDIQWVDKEGQAHQVRSACVDFSKGGLCLEHDFAISPDVIVSFCFQSEHPHSQKVKAKVTRCLKLIDGRYSIGLKIL